MTYKLKIAQVERALPLCKVSDDLYIAAFVIFGDVEITKVCASELLKVIPDCDLLITAESKGIPLVYEMSRQSGLPYLIARKSAKLYMREAFSVEVRSITTASRQTLFIDKNDSEAMKGKRIVLIDDVISTGESLRALEKLVLMSEGIIAGKMAILAEGDACIREDIQYLEKLPLFDAEGQAL